MKFLPLLELYITHDYYKDGSCPDFTIEADSFTQKTLQNHRCILKKNQTGFVISQSVNNDDTPVIRMSLLTVLRFNLILINSKFSLFTDLSHFPDQGSYLFTNKDISNNVLKIGSADSQQRKTSFATIEIFINESIVPVKKDPVFYHTPLTARHAYWEYFFITSSNTDDSDFQIKHVEQQEAAPQDTTQIIFNKKIPDSQAITDWISKQYPTENLLYFVSENPVKCQQTPRKNIQLLMNGERLLDNLPNPPISNNNRRVGTDGGTTPQDTFFYIVKYITHSFLTTGI